MGIELALLWANKKSKNMKYLLSRSISSLLLLFIATSISWAQLQPDLQFFRYRDQRGVNVYETWNKDTIPYEDLKIRLGANFWQSFQALSHENVYGTDSLYGLGSGFNLATANLNLDVQLEDGIRVAVESYMSSRHHPEFWVKGGYLQVDKITIFGEGSFIDFWTKHLSWKVGHFEVNYGDMHFRRSDNANDVYNPFVENALVDGFATEIGTELYYYTDPGLFFMAGITNGEIKGDISDADRGPSILAKIGYDKQINEDFRFRLTGSYYGNSNAARSTLYSGDRAGSHYYLVMAEPGASATRDFTSGRVDPVHTKEISAISVSTFLKFKGAELFGFYETSTGKGYADDALDLDSRGMNQIYVDVLYRFLKREQLYVGLKYNTVSGNLLDGNANDEQSVQRIAFAAGWYVTKNILGKVEYVTQEYSDYPMGSTLDQGKFDGIMVTGSVNF